MAGGLSWGTQIQMTSLQDFNKLREDAGLEAFPGEINSLLAYTRSEFRPTWMSDEQWNQFIRWNRGEAVPTDPEIVSALRLEDESSRGYRWVYRSVPGCLVGPGSYEQWCQFIDEGMDVGL